MNFRSAAALLIASVFAASSCSASEREPSSAEQPTTSVESTSVYPPVQYRTDVLDSVSPQLSDAANLALGAYVDGFEVVRTDVSEEVRARYMSSISSDVTIYPTAVDPPGFVARTGGAVIRAVSAVELEASLVEVAICYYRTPGMYSVFEDGSIVGPDSRMPLYSLDRPKVQWTDRPAADGRPTAGPRWLMVDRGVELNRTDEEASQMCEPFKPDPFVQAMPDPITPTSAPR